MYLPQVVQDIIQGYIKDLETTEKYDIVMQELEVFGGVFENPDDTITLIRIGKMNLDLNHRLSKNVIRCIFSDMSTRELVGTIAALKWAPTLA